MAGLREEQRALALHTKMEISWGVIRTSGSCSLSLLVYLSLGKPEPM